MNATGHNPVKHGPDAGSYEETLRMVTHAPVPEGLEERVHAALQAAPRRASVLEWPGTAGWMRAAAAAAIVAIVAGGGWGVFRHVQQQRAAKVIVMPTPQVAAPVSGGFSSAGAIRTPQTVKGPVVQQMPRKKTARKAAAHPAKSAETAKPAEPVAAGAGK